MDELTPKPRRFWRPRFGLRWLFVLATVAIVVTAWVTYSLNWIRQRNEVVQSGMVFTDDFGHVPTAPSGLWLFGELRWFAVAATYSSEAEYERIERLFPEVTEFMTVESWEQSVPASGHGTGYWPPPVTRLNRHHRD